jgi:hypothetical protein
MYRSLCDYGSLTEYGYVLRVQTVVLRVVLNPIQSPYLTIFLPLLIGQWMRPSLRRGRQILLRSVEGPTSTSANPPCSFHP